MYWICITHFLFFFHFFFNSVTPPPLLFFFFFSALIAIQGTEVPRPGIEPMLWL